MKIGSLKTFGKLNKAGVRFGFLERLGGIGEIYFNEKQIDRSSRFLEQCCAGDYVVYEERQFDNGSSAFRVKPLKELNEKALHRLYEECRDEVRAAELELLIKTAPELLDQESPENIVSLVTQLRGKSPALILMRKPELLWTSSEVCARVKWDDIKNLPLDKLFQTDEQVEFMARWMTDESTWSAIVRELPGRLVLRCQRALDGVSDDRASSILSEIDWTDTGEDSLERCRPLLMKLHWDGFPKSITAAAASLQEQGMALELCWWKLFTNSMKVRLLIYLTNFKEKREEQDWFHALQKVQRWEREAGNGLTCAVLQYFAGMYAKTEKQYMDNFLKAHDMLMNYITDSFTKETDVTPGLSSLLEHCRDTTSDYSFFCDGRVWEKANRIYCPIVGHSCIYYPDTDLTKTRFRGSSGAGAESYVLQSFMDFLLNIGGIPDLTPIGIRKERYEYPFRGISGYVNGLIRMRPHMKCSCCGELFHPRFEYTKRVTARVPISMFYCSRSGQDEAHDRDVYLNFCYHCHEIIDSRECKILDRGPEQNTSPESGRRFRQYLCMHCGGAQNTKPGTVCPQCGCSDPELLSAPSNKKISCKNCGYDSRRFRSKFEEMLNS